MVWQSSTSVNQARKCGIKVTGKCLTLVGIVQLVLAESQVVERRLVANVEQILARTVRVASMSISTSKPATHQHSKPATAAGGCLSKDSSSSVLIARESSGCGGCFRSAGRFPGTKPLTGSGGVAGGSPRGREPMASSSSRRLSSSTV
jgi:hypothetical protein